MAGVGILGNAVSGLITNQTALRYTSTNIANVNNPDFARRQVNLQSRLSGGVEIADINRIANEFLAREAYGATASASAADIIAKLHDRLQSLLGDPSADNSIDSKINSMFGDLSEMQIDPTSNVRRDTGLNGVEVVLDDLDKLATSVQTIRNYANQDIASRIQTANGLIKNIYQLNLQIVAASSLESETGALFDQRQHALNSLAEIIDIRISTQSDGQAYVATSDGVFMISTTMSELRHQVGSIVNPDTIFDRITLHSYDFASGAVNPVGQLLEPHVSSGELRGLLEMRDVTLPKIATEIAELASKLTDQLNAVHNDNSAVPAPNQLIGGNTGLLAADAHNFSGISNFSVVDAAGLTVVRVQADFTNNQYRINGGAPVAFGGTTIGSAVAAINAGLGAAGTLSFAAGVMSLSAANPAHGVAMVEDPATPSTRAGRGFAHFFGLNDLVKSSVPVHYETGLSAAQAHGFTAGSTAQFKLINSNGQVFSNFTLTVAGATIGDLITQLNAGLGSYGSFVLNPKGELVFTPSPIAEGSTLFSIDDLTNRGGTGRSLSSMFGIGPGARQFQPNGLSIRADIDANSSLLALAKLDLSAPGTLALGIADDRGAIAFHALEEKVINFAAAGHITGLNSSLSDYSAQFLSSVARLSAQAETVSNDRSGIRDEINAQISDISGVNLDEELANLVVYQNAYNASARMIKAADELFKTLLDAV
jgi:flagellar hook-associated protein 1